MMSDKKKSLYFLVFIILISSVHAFELKTSEQSLSLCPRDTQLFIDLVRNDGQSEQAFDVKVSTLSEQKTARHSLIVKDCHLLKTSADLAKETCPKEVLTYDISITNLGE